MNVNSRYLKIFLVLPLALFIASFAAVVAQDLMDDYYLSHPRVLIDASRDGGVWWYPQPLPSGEFDPLQYHQGKPLADYLRSQGMLVDELPRPYEITDALLRQYELVVRAGWYPLSSYEPPEIDAYARFVSEGGRLVLVSEYAWSSGGLRDDLAEYFGIFMGLNEYGVIVDFAEHPITEGVSSIFYNHGSVLVESAPPGAVELAFIDEQTALGIMPFGYGQIIFMGDTQSLFSAEQPLTENIFTFFLTVEGLASQVMLVDLDANAEKGLLNKLEAAFRALDSGRTTPFKNQIEAFINQVEALLLSGRIDPVAAETLIGAALNLIGGDIPAEEDACPCWTEEQIALVPVPGEVATCGLTEYGLDINQSGCEHDFSVLYHEWGASCASNRYCIEPYGAFQAALNDVEQEVCEQQIRDRCKELKIKLPK